MNKLGIIGLGVISKNYLLGIKNSSFFKLTAVCDVNSNAPTKEFYSDYKFFLDYKKMINACNLNYVLISTPPITHFEIAKSCLEMGVNVILEKPAVLNDKQFSILENIAKTKSLKLEVLFHFHHASEVKYFNDNFDFSKIEKIKVEIFDPYSQDGENICENRQSLHGTWLDSGSNALSLIKMWLPFNDVKVLQTKKIDCKTSNMPIYSQVDMSIDNIPTQITIDWTKGINKKTIYLNYDGKEIILDSSNQRIVFNNTITSFNDMERLERHYFNFFTIYKGEENIESARLIHQALFIVNNLL